MSQKLVNRNPDLARLVERGYAVAFDSGHLVVRDIPYLARDGSLHRGAIVTVLSVHGPDQDVVCQQDHQIYFAGGPPCGLDGNPIPNLGDRPTQLALSPCCADVVVERMFSNKPTPANRFDDFFHKIESYATIISGPAMERYGATPLTFRTVESADENSVFKFRDTLSTRARIADLGARFDDEVVAIIGLGGTGAYILDFLVKTPVKEIRGFDADSYHVHNAYRSPGRLNADELDRPKAEVYQGRYENFRQGLELKRMYLDATSANELEGVTFAFVCVDQGPARAEIFDLLMQLRIPFIDVGMGLARKSDGLSGMLRVTYFSPDDAEKVRALRLAEENATPENMYKANIQIGELNAMNAALAVIKFKQLRRFYVQEPNINVLFNIRDYAMTVQHLDG